MAPRKRSKSVKITDAFREILKNEIHSLRFLFLISPKVLVVELSTFIERRLNNRVEVSAAER